jgi:hypothetical protein
MGWNVLLPGIEFLIYYLAFRFSRRFSDNPCFYLACCCRKKYRFVTKTTTIPSYLEIYSGPVYYIHYKYSFMINIVFISLMFGPGIPVLFPIALLSLSVFYVIERLLVAYSYRSPPLFDQSLNREVIEMLMLAPILFCAFGFWMYSNNQIFDKEVYFLETYSQDMITNHTISGAISKI